MRSWRAGDAPTIHELVSRSLEHLAPWMPWAADGYTEQDAVRFAESCENDRVDGAAFNYAVVLPDGEIAGSCALMARGPGGFEIGYWLRPEHVGRGIATRAASALVEEALRLGAERVEIVHDVANVRSGAIPQRLGFTEVERRRLQGPLTSGRTGLDIVWRLTRPP